MLIGPYVDLNRSVSKVTENSIVATEQFLGDALNNVSCSSLECYGTKVALSVGLAQLSEQTLEAGESEQREILSNSPSSITPIPLPRLVRKG